MFFTNGEILCFLSLIKQGNLFGMNITLPAKEKRAEYVKDAVEKMKGKGYLDPSGKLRKIMQVPIQFFRKYTGAKEYIFINRMRCAVLPDNKLAVLVPKTDGAEIFFANRIEVAVALLKGYPELCKANPEESVLSQLREMNFTQWEKGLADKPVQNILAVTRFEHRDIKQSRIYFWTNDENGVYDFMKKETRNLSALDMRLNLMHLLEVVETEEDENGKYRNRDGRRPTQLLF